MAETDLRESDVALVDAVKVLIELLMKAEIAQPAALDRQFAQQRDAYMADQMPTAAGIVEHLRQFATATGRETSEAGLKTLLRDPPQGSA